jgi:hypothetical protein
VAGLPIAVGGIEQPDGRWRRCRRIENAERQGLLTPIVLKSNAFCAAVVIA